TYPTSLQVNSTWQPRRWCRPGVGSPVDGQVAARCQTPLIAGLGAHRMTAGAGAGAATYSVGIWTAGARPHVTVGQQGSCNRLTGSGCTIPGRLAREAKGPCTPSSR